MSFTESCPLFSTGTIEKGPLSVSFIERLSSLQYWYNREGTSKCVLYREVVLSSVLV